MKKISFNIFCESSLDKLYNSNLSDEQQSEGYKNLKKMVINNIEPHSLKEIERWEKTPTNEELFGTPDIKYLRFIHSNLRPLIIGNWKTISKLKI
jgi:hypothetical protein